MEEERIEKSTQSLVIRINHKVQLEKSVPVTEEKWKLFNTDFIE